MGEILNLKSIENHGTVRNYSAFSSTISYKFLFLNFLIIAKLNRIKKKPNRGCKKKNKMCYSTTQVCKCNEETRTNYSYTPKNYNCSTRDCTNTEVDDINYRANSTKYNEYLEWARNNP